jgi:hypothetical protein
MAAFLLCTAGRAEGREIAAFMESWTFLLGDAPNASAAEFDDSQ